MGQKIGISSNNALSVLEGILYFILRTLIKILSNFVIEEIISDLKSGIIIITGISHGSSIII